MTDISQIILQQAGIRASSFSPTSRYNGLPTNSMQGKNGETIVFLRRRIVPKAEKFFVLQKHTVKEGDRIDNVAYQYYGDPERFWQICDSNNVMDPAQLLDLPGSKINITLPDGIPGNTNA
ncbi:MAG TPA: hypothetical protein VL098_14455 [Flavipsychrobacter sp.]|nr:hypothetical protein [Flavipsychrobacter sp.]